jgi:hypothetical protein
MAAEPLRFRAGKRHGAGSTPRGVLGDDQAVLADTARELGMRRGVVAIDPAAQDSRVGLDRPAACNAKSADTAVTGRLTKG